MAFIENLVFENVHIMWYDFVGTKGPYNPYGEKSLAVRIDNPEDAKQLMNEGWNIGILKPTDEYEEPGYVLKNVKIKWKGEFGPKVFLYTKNRRVQLDDETIAQLQNIRFANVDIVIGPRKYIDSKDGTEKISAWLRELHVTMVEGPFDAKYAHYDDPMHDPDDIPFE